MGTSAIVPINRTTTQLSHILKDNEASMVLRANALDSSRKPKAIQRNPIATPADTTRVSICQTRCVRYRGKKTASTEAIATTFPKYQRSGTRVKVDSSRATAMNAANGKVRAAVQSSSNGCGVLL